MKLRLLLLVLGFLFSTNLSWAAVPVVTVIEVHGAVWPGTATFVRHQMDEATRSGSAGIILDLDTSSGTSGAAEDIVSAIHEHAGDLPIAAYVHDRATGPGALIAVACKILAVSPTATLGGVTSTDLKTELRSAAESTGRNPNIAMAFVSAESPLPAIGVKAGDMLTLTSTQAKSVGYADVVATDYPAILTKMGLPTASVSSVSLNPWMATALFISQPWVTILMLAFGLVLVIVEILTLHTYGIAGVIGGIMLASIFAAHIASGTGTWVGILLFIGGIALVLFETHILPGHGIAAMAGLALVFLGIFFGLGGTQSGALASMTISLIATVLILVAFLGYLPRSRVWQKIGQPMRQTATEGYVSTDDFTGYIGAIGVAITLLRPSGTADFDGMRLPVVTEGGFVSEGSQVQVILVQGSRIVVRSLEQV